MPNKEECLNAIDVVARYCNEVKLGHVPPRFELTNELDVLMQLINERFANTLDFKGFKLHSDSTLNTFKKSELIDYIHMVYRNWQGTDWACNNGIKYAEKLQKRIDELQRVVDELNSKETRSNPPLEFKDIESMGGKPIFDTKDSEWLIVVKTLPESERIECVNQNGMRFCKLFIDDRYYRYEMEEMGV